jgi:3-deoxy-D-manno-octulosonic-acid transferase
LPPNTRDTEEGPLLQAWKAQVRMAEAAAENVPRLLIVPRHPQRFDAVAALVVQNGFSLSRRSAWPGGQPDAQARAAQVWLGDSLGEMPAYFAAARVALLGGSFAPVGGQNLIEAAACGCPLVMGPSTFNFAQAAEESLSAGAALRVRNASQGVTAALAILDDPEARAAMRRAGLRFTAISRGAARRQARAILALLDPPGGAAVHPGPDQFQAT